MKKYKIIYKGLDTLDTIETQIQELVMEGYEVKDIHLPYILMERVKCFEKCVVRSKTFAGFERELNGRHAVKFKLVDFQYIDDYYVGVLEREI